MIPSPLVARVFKSVRHHLFAATTVLALSSSSSMATSHSDALYRDLGGAEGIDALVEQFLYRLADDPRVNHFFAESNVGRLHAKLVEQFCMLSGGPCQYSGDTMRETHAGMAVTTAAFNALVDDLIEAMDACHVGTGAQNRLLARLAPMHGEIIEKR